MNKFSIRCQSRQAFSLIEVTIALAVTSVSSLVMLGLLSTGLQSLHQAIGTTTQAQIIQSVINNAQVQSYNNGTYTNSTGAVPAVYYFDDEGNLTNSTTPQWTYKATVQDATLNLPGATPGTSAAVANSTARLLQIVITAANNPNGAVTNTLVWPNTGS